MDALFEAIFEIDDMSFGDWNAIGDNDHGRIVTLPGLA
jgi:hypothetical protein